MWRVPFVDLGAQYQSLKPEIDAATQRVLASGKYTSSVETERFESAMAAYLGVNHVIACGNGYDALYMALKVVGVDRGFTVLTDEYTHVSTHAAIVAAGGIVALDRNKLDRPPLVYLPVHMNGAMEPPEDCGAQFVIEDACQAIGASFGGRKAGTFGDMGCFSLHPMKILGCAGDGGFIATDHEHFDAALRRMRNHGGGQGYGVNSRLDALQAAILMVKLPHLDRWIARRREIAGMYYEGMPTWVRHPTVPNDGPYFDAYSSYVIEGEPALLAHLRDKGIECFSHIRTDVVSLPIYAEMTDDQVNMVIEAVKSYG